MKFCPSCKGILIPKKIKPTESNSSIIQIKNVCVRCNKEYEFLEKDNVRFKKIFDHSKDNVIMVDNTSKPVEPNETYIEFELDKPEQEEY